MANELKPCPFCSTPLTIRGGVNPYGRCNTDGCWMMEAKLSVVCDDPKQVERWNTRPAAPVEGLETVGVQYAHEHSITGRAMWGWQKEWKGCAAIGTRDLVTRTQAEAIIAAKDKRIETLWDDRNNVLKRLGTLDADNAALTARVKELEHSELVKGVNTKYANALAYLEMTEDDDPEEFAKRLWDEREALETQLTAARKALTEIYGNGDATGCNPQIKVDIARAALEDRP